MTKITIEIDTRLDETLTSDATVEAKNRVKLSASKIGLLSTIAITQPLSDAFWSAISQTKEESPGSGSYKNSDISNGKNHLKNSKNCKVIATAGGMPAFTAVNGDNDIPFVSLVGMVPSAINSQCSGGVSLESYKSSLRRNYLLGLGQLPANIYLLTNNNSSLFHQYEINDWNSGTLLVSYVGGDGSGNNDASKFSWDWVGDGGGNPPKLPSTATGVVISDDPFFQANQSLWMPQVNTWLAANATRRIVFPNGNYSPSGSYANKMTVIGCDLVAAYRLLGALAASVSLNPNVNFGFIRLAWP